MVKIQFLGSSPEYVEGFPAKLERTFDGALHLKPKKVCEISESEFEFVKKLRPDLKFHVFKAEKKFERKIAKAEPQVALVEPQVALVEPLVKSKKLSKSSGKKKKK